MARSNSLPWSIARGLESISERAKLNPARTTITVTRIFADFRACGREGQLFDATVRDDIERNGRI
jgi:hypothetical protein